MAAKTRSPSASSSTTAGKARAIRTSGSQPFFLPTRRYRTHRAGATGRVDGSSRGQLRRRLAFVLRRASRPHQVRRNAAGRMRCTSTPDGKIFYGSATRGTYPPTFTSVFLAKEVWMPQRTESRLSASRGAFIKYRQLRPKAAAPGAIDNSGYHRCPSSFFSIRSTPDTCSPNQVYGGRFTCFILVSYQPPWFNFQALIGTKAVFRPDLMLVIGMQVVSPV